MNISKAIELGREKSWSDAYARVNPSDTRQWYIMLLDRDEKSYILVDDDEIPITHQDLNFFVPVLQKIGIKAFHVMLM